MISSHTDQQHYMTDQIRDVEKGNIAHELCLSFEKRWLIELSRTLALHYRSPQSQPYVTNFKQNIDLNTFYEIYFMSKGNSFPFHDSVC